MTEKPKTTHICERCGKQTEAARLPLRWKRTTSGEQCNVCWHAQYVARAVTIPLWGSGDDKPFADFCAALREQWSEATRLANWIHTERYARDARREAGMKKLPKMENHYLYQEARLLCPALMPSVVTAIDHAETAKYRARRYDILWLGKASLANVRYPLPLPLPARTIGFARDKENDRINVSVRFGAAAEGTRWIVRVAGGKDYLRQTQAIRQMMSGEVELIEGSLYQAPARVSDGRASGGGSRIMLKLVGWFPVATPAASKKRMSLKTGVEEFLYGVVEGSSEPWALHADHVRDWAWQHVRLRRRIAADQKATGWKPKRRRKQAKQTLADRCLKHRSRMDTFVKQAAAAAVDHARRRRVETLSYDDSERGYFPEFGWDRLRQQLQNKCKEAGIVLELASDAVEQKTTSAARKKRKVSDGK